MRLSFLRSSLSPVACALTAALALPGCVTTAPYVNIPSQHGDVARSSPDAGNVVNAEVAALAALLEAKQITGSVLIKLPEGSSEKTYAKVVEKLSKNATAERLLVTPEDESMAQLTVQVTSLRLRGESGHVDIVSPGRGGVPQLATVDLSYTLLDGWVVDRVRHSSAPVHPEILYVPNVAPKPADAPEDDASEG